MWTVANVRCCIGPFTSAIFDVIFFAISSVILSRGCTASFAGVNHPPPRPGVGGYVKDPGMLVKKFELNKGDQSGHGSSFFDP